MKTIARRPLAGFGLALPVSLLVAAMAGIAVGAIDTSTYRIGISSDGNQHDEDDIGAAPMALAIIAEAGLIDKLVHHDYNNHLGDNDATKAQKMVDSVNGAATRWEIGTSVLFNDQTHLAAAVANIAAQINASSADNRFYLAAGGPMETVWQGINASDQAKRQYTTVISHSSWNETHADTPQMTHTWSNVKTTGVVTVEIPDQNQHLGNTALADWNWLKDSSDPDWQWLYSRNQFGNKFDVSDAGMVWYIITGRGQTNATPQDVHTLFTANSEPGGGGPGPGSAASIEYTDFTPLHGSGSGDLTASGVTATVTSATGGTFAGTTTYLGHSGGHSTNFDNHEGFSVVFSEGLALTGIRFADMSGIEQFTLKLGNGSTQTFSGGQIDANGLFDVAANYSGSNVLTAGQELVFLAVPATDATNSRFRVTGITAVIPEPASIGMVLAGLCMLAQRRRRKLAPPGHRCDIGI
ncbi:MAG: PEP-CTERM sorting domain-containing protein [Phycisphaeraceae bacterium]